MLEDIIVENSFLQESYRTFSVQCDSLLEEVIRSKTELENAQVQHCHLVECLVDLGAQKAVDWARIKVKIANTEACEMFA